MFLKIILATLMLIHASWLCAANYQNVIGFGQGGNEEQALTQAKTDAIEKSVGLMLSSRSIVDNYVTISDLIVSKANGLIKKYSVVNKVCLDGIWQVEIRAEVVEVVDEIIKDQAAINLLIAEMGIPAFGVVVNKENGERDYNAENILTAELLQKGFKIKKLTSGKVEDLSEISKQGIDYVLSGNVASENVNMSNIYNIQSIKSVQSTLECRLINCLNNEIVSAKTIAGKGAHISEVTAKLKSLHDCIPRVTSYLLVSAIGRWSRDASTNLKELEMDICNVDGRNASLIYSFMAEKFQGVELISDKGYADGKQSFVLRTLSSSDQLLKLLNMQPEFEGRYELLSNNRQKIVVALKSVK